MDFKILINPHQLTQCKDFMVKLSEERVYSDSSPKDVAKHSPIQGGSANPPRPGAAVTPHPAAWVTAAIIWAYVNYKCGGQKTVFLHGLIEPGWHDPHCGHFLVKSRQRRHRTPALVQQALSIGSDRVPSPYNSFHSNMARLYHSHPY